MECDTIICRIKAGFLSVSVDTARLSESIRKRGATSMFAIIQTGGKQYKVNVGDVLFIEKLDVNEGETVTFDCVKALSNGETLKVGTPNVEGATVTANVLKNGKAKKIYVLKYKSKKNEKKKIGHRQPYTKVEITAING